MLLMHPQREQETTFCTSAVSLLVVPMCKAAPDVPVLKSTSLLPLLSFRVTKGRTAFNQALRLYFTSAMSALLDAYFKKADWFSSILQVGWIWRAAACCLPAPAASLLPHVGESAETKSWKWTNSRYFFPADTTGALAMRTSFYLLLGFEFSLRWQTWNTDHVNAICKSQPAHKGGMSKNVKCSR